MLPPQEPPTSDTQPHPPTAIAARQVAPPGQKPPHTALPEGSLPHGRTQRSAGPGQQVVEPTPTQTHACSQVPPTQRSDVHGLLSVQSASDAQTGGRVVVVVGGSVVVGDPVQRGLHTSFGFPHGC